MTGEQNQIHHLLFIYNAKSALGNKVWDGLHKAFSPATYNCNLCAITFGNLNERKAWKAFREKAPLPMEFLYRDEFERQYASKFGHRFTYPIILVSGHGELEVLITTEELNSMDSHVELMALLEARWSGLS